jgi:hypothetical protein
MQLPIVNVNGHGSYQHFALSYHTRENILLYMRFTYTSSGSFVIDSNLVKRDRREYLLMEQKLCYSSKDEQKADIFFYIFTWIYEFCYL